MAEAKMNEIVARLIGDATYIGCPNCPGYNAYSTDCIIANEGWYYAEYFCEECNNTLEYRCVPKNLGEVDADSDSECEDLDPQFDFDALRRTILGSKGKFANIKALLDYYDVDSEYSIPEIYENLKKNYSRNESYILHKLCFAKPSIVWDEVSKDLFVFDNGYKSWSEMIEKNCEELDELYLGESSGMHIHELKNLTGIGNGKYRVRIVFMSTLDCSFIEWVMELDRNGNILSKHLIN